MKRVVKIVDKNFKNNKINLTDKEKKNKKKIRKLIIVFIIFILAVTIFLTAYYFITGNSIITTIKNMKAEEEFTYVLDDFVVNLQGSSSHYLKAKIALAYSNKKEVEILTENNSKIRDTIIQDLRSRKAEEILESPSFEKIKNNLKSDINSLLTKDIITNIYFTDFLVQ